MFLNLNLVHSPLNSNPPSLLFFFSLMSNKLTKTPEIIMIQDYYPPLTPLRLVKQTIDTKRNRLNIIVIALLPVSTVTTPISSTTVTITIVHRVVI